MTSTYTDFTQQYYDLREDLNSLIKKYSIQQECPSCKGRIIISQYHITTEWNGIRIQTRAFCPICNESRNYNTIVR